jgi:superfamily II DNA helicase RecQ
VYRQLFVAAEQLGATGGHITRFAKYTWDAAFLNRISILYIDEAHYIRGAGLPIGKVPAFRPSWGKLYDLRVRLPHGIPAALFSASMAPNVLHTVMENSFSHACPSKSLVHLMQRFIAWTKSTSRKHVDDLSTDPTAVQIEPKCDWTEKIVVRSCLE